MNKTIVDYSDINTTMTVIEFIAHDDAITCLSLIDDPFCFVSGSKDKKIRIWGAQCQLLGELSISNSINSMNMKSVSEWKFKVDWEKLKQEEIEEVIKIFEELGGEPVKFDETKLEEVVVEQVQVETKKKQERIFVPNKRRFKPMEEYRKELLENAEDKENNFNIDDQYHQEIIDNINKVIYPTISSTGLSEMTKNLLEGNKNLREEKKDDGVKDKNLIENKIKQKANKIASINNAPMKSINRNLLYSEKRNAPTNNQLGSINLPSLYDSKNTYFNKEYMRIKAKEKKDHK